MNIWYTWKEIVINKGIPSCGKKHKTQDEAGHHKNLTPIYTSGQGIWKTPILMY